MSCTPSTLETAWRIFITIQLVMISWSVLGLSRTIGALLKTLLGILERMPPPDDGRPKP